MKTVVKRGFVLIVAVVLLFTAAFQPRVKAVGPGTIAVVAGVAGALAFSAAWLAYARANGVDLSVYNMLSGQDLVDAITDLVQQYLNDERDGISANAYFDSIGLPSIVKFAYDTAGSYLAGGVKAIISALGIATVFEPFTQWFLANEDYIDVSGSQDGLVYYPESLTSIESVVYRVLAGSKVSLFGSSNSMIYSKLPSSSDMFSACSFRTYNFSVVLADSSQVVRTFDFGTITSTWNLNSVKANSTFSCNLRRGGNSVQVSRTVSDVGWSGTGPFTGTFYSLLFVDSDTGRVYSGVGAFIQGSVHSLLISNNFLDVSAIFTGIVPYLQSDDGTNRYPSTSVASGMELQIPVSIPNVSVDYPTISDTEEQQSNDIANAILAGQIDNDFSVTTSDVVIANETATPTTVPTTIPSAMPSPVPSITPIPEEYTPDITMFFPFCIPFDMYRLVGVFLGEPQAPVIRWEFTIPIIRQEAFVIEIDLSPYDGVASLLRKLETVAFVVGLAVATRKFISW